MVDAYKNFAISSVATAPSPAASGVTIVLAAGDGARFPVAPFNVTIGPSGVVLTPVNSEIVRVTARSVDTLTVTRAQETSTARTVVVGDQLFAGITAGFMDQMAPTLSPAFTGVATLAVATPITPPAGKIGVFGRLMGGRMMIAQVGPSGLDTSLQPNFARNKVSFAQPTGNSTGISLTGISIAGTGTVTAKSWANGSLYDQMRGISYLAALATTAVAGVRTAAGQFSRGSVAGTGGFHFITRWAVTTGGAITTNRAFVGLVGGAAAPTDVNPSTLLNMCGMAWDDLDTNIQWMVNAGAGTATKVDLGASFPVPTTLNSVPYEVAIFCAPASTTVSYEITNLVTGAVASGSSTANLPVNTVGLQCSGYASVGGTSSAIGFTLYGLYIETDY